LRGRAITYEDRLVENIRRPPVSVVIIVTGCHVVILIAHEEVERWLSGVFLRNGVWYFRRDWRGF
jgi:hypothetical protein